MTVIWTRSLAAASTAPYHERGYFSWKNRMDYLSYY